jgi:hypothetical protein
VLPLLLPDDEGDEELLLDVRGCELLLLLLLEEEERLLPLKISLKALPLELLFVLVL